MGQGDDLRYLRVVLVLVGVLWPARWARYTGHSHYPPTIAGDHATAGSDEEIEAESLFSLDGPYPMKIPGVWGSGAYGSFDGHMYIRVMAEAITPEIEREVPKTLGRFPVVIVLNLDSTPLKRHSLRSTSLWIVDGWQLRYWARAAR